METKFTPWRLKYINDSNQPDQPEGCVLCRLPQAPKKDDPSNLVLYRGEHCYIVLNLYPYNTGHLMIVPYVHTADLPGLADAVAQELFSLSRLSVAWLAKEYQPHGFNLGMNLGRIAGAGIDDHLHLHIVPRWSGDSNFMPIIGGTKLIPEALDQTYARLHPYFQAFEEANLQLS